MMDNDTIASVSTAVGTGAIGIVRVSGKDAFEIGGRIFKGRKSVFNDIKSHTISYGKIIDPQNDCVLDQVLLSKMQEPSTYTKEDVIEINCHGGMNVVRNVLNLVIRCGARLAEPGEFTMRAFLNGRIDLSQAEAVMDVINSKTQESLRASVDQLEGKLSKGVRLVRNRLVGLLSHIEALVDYPEYDIEEISHDRVLEDCEWVKSELKAMLDSFERGRLFREGLNVVITGRPNVGKSSLLNCLSGRERAIVTEIPGTTRDIIEESVDIAGIPVNLVDTAGIRDTDDIVENIGVKMARNYISKADLVMLVIDASEALLKEDLEIFESLEDRRKLVIINKIDKAEISHICRIEKAFKGADVLKVSVLEEQGIEEVEKFFIKGFLAGEISTNNEILLTNIRHKNLAEMAVKDIDDALSSLESGMPIDIISIDIKNCAEKLGNITGESVGEDVLKEIFSRFCIGK